MFGLFLSLIFIYLIIWKPQIGSLVSGSIDLKSALFGEMRIDFYHLLQILGAIKATPIVLAFFITPLHVLLRSHRWSLMVRNLCHLKLIDSFSLQMVGYLANSILPLRMGEVVRGGMLAQKQNIPISSGLGTVLIERILDMFSLLFLVGAVSIFFPFPREFAHAAIAFSFISFAGIFIAAYLAIDKDPLGGRIGRIFGGGKTARFIAAKGTELAAGFSMLRQTRHHFVIILETFVIWMLYALQGYLVLIAFDFPRLYQAIGDQPILASFIILIIDSIGIALPSAPAGVGTFHAVLIFGLSLFDVLADHAGGFAIVIHAIPTIFYIIFGMPFMWREGLHISELKKIEESELESKKRRRTS